LPLPSKLDFLALSFVQSASDVRFLKQALAERGANIPVIAKIERKKRARRHRTHRQGMLWRNGRSRRPRTGNELRRCSHCAENRLFQRAGKPVLPVITATQMLESMTNFHKPTRAEAADVANAILDGTDAVMLSGESAVGKFPVEVVSTMAMIAARAEQAWLNGELPGLPELSRNADLDAAVGQATAMIASTVSARAIITATTSGTTPRRVACHRPKNADYRIMYVPGDLPSHEF